VFLNGQPCCSSYGGRTPASPNFETSYMHAHGIRKTNQILHGDQTRWGNNFTGLSMPLPWPKIFVTRMLTHDLFAIANLLVAKVALSVACILKKWPGMRKKWHNKNQTKKHKWYHTWQQKYMGPGAPEKLGTPSPTWNLSFVFIYDIWKCKSRINCKKKFIKLKWQQKNFLVQK